MKMGFCEKNSEFKDDNNCKLNLEKKIVYSENNKLLNREIDFYV